MFYEQLLWLMLPEIILGTGRNPVKELGTEIENAKHVNGLMIGPGTVIIEKTGTIEIGRRIGRETGKGKEREIVGVIGIRGVIVVGIVTVIEKGTGIATVKGTGIMMLVMQIEVAHMIESLSMIVLNLNMRGTNMVRESETMILKKIVVGLINLSMDIVMLTLIMILSSMNTMSIIEGVDNMIVGMTMGTITINILTMTGWKMTITLNVEHLNHVTGREIVTWTVNTIVQRGLILGSMTTKS